MPRRENNRQVVEGAGIEIGREKEDRGKIIGNPGQIRRNENENHFILWKGFSS